MSGEPTRVGDARGAEGHGIAPWHEPFRQE